MVLFAAVSVVCVLMPAGARPAGATMVAPVLSAGDVMPGAGVAAPAATADPQRQADLVAQEDERITRALRSPAQLKRDGVSPKPYRTRPNGRYTLVLTARRRAYTFDDLRKLSSDTLLPQADGSFLLLEHILVGPGATLEINRSRPLVLKMSSGPDGFVSIVSDGGRIRLDGTATAPITIESWDPSRGRQDTDLGDGRAYVRAGGQLVVRNTTFSRLGFWSGRTGGVALVASTSQLGTAVDTAAVAPAKDGSGSFASSVADATMTQDAFGLFISGASGTVVSDTVIRRSLVDGLVLHRNVESARISGVRVERSAVDGVVVARNVESAVLTRLDVRANGRDGVVLSGSPLAEGPSAGGASIRAFGNNTLTTSKSSDNGRIGVHVIGGTAVTVQGNTVSGGLSGVVVSNRAEDVTVAGNTVTGARGNGIQVRDSTKVAVTANSVIDSATGLHILDAVATLRDNSTSGVTLHGITFVGAVAGSVADGNRLRGSGTSPVDVVRVTGAGPKILDSDESGWSRIATKDSLISIVMHPLTMIWIGVAIVLIGLSRPRRGGTRAPYRTDAPIGRDGPPNAPSPVVIDLAIRQARLNPATPRRHRAVGR